MKKKLQRAVFAAGCFWSPQYFFDQLPGVIKTTVGYCGGDAQKPSYEQVLTGRTGHSESVEITFDPARISYRDLIISFFEMHDSSHLTNEGSQYKSIIFYINDEQKKIATSIMEELKNGGADIPTELKKASKFWPAEEYHQKYYEKSGVPPSCGACG